MPILTFSEHQSMVEKYPLIDSKIAAEVLWTFDRDTRYGKEPTVSRRKAIELAGRVDGDYLRIMARFTAVAQAVLCYQDERLGLLYLRERAAAQ